MGKTISCVGLMLFVGIAVHRSTFDNSWFITGFRVLVTLCVFMHWTQVGLWLSYKMAKQPLDEDRAVLWQAMRNRFIALAVLLEGINWYITPVLAYPNVDAGSLG